MMRMSLLTLAALLVAVGNAFGSASFVLSTQDGVGLYKNQVRAVHEVALVTVSAKERLKVVAVKGASTKVRTENGKEGWVESRLVADASGKSFHYQDAEILGYFDDPNIAIVNVALADDYTPTKINRSFAESVKQNTDLETIERQVQ